MKGSHPRSIAFLGAVVNAGAFGSLFLTYATTTYFGDNIYPLRSTASQAAIETKGWAYLFDSGTTPVSLEYWLIPSLVLFSIFFPLSLFLVRFLWHAHPRLFLWSSLASLLDVIWCLLLDAILGSATITADEMLHTFQPGAGLLLLCLCISSVCGISLWKTSRKVL